MPLKILLADDSVTAQKMGKDILVGAGYEVIAVSNGAAAAKKLAEKPDIAIFDILMPGYTGLELCERVRNNVATAKMPVLLTVGKMEHFDQKDVQRVKADGVIVKPFEASDLLAAVGKLASAAAPGKVASHSVDESGEYAAWKKETIELPPLTAPIEIPKEVAGSAFMMPDTAVETHTPPAMSFDEPAPSPPAPPIPEISMAAAAAVSTPTAASAEASPKIEPEASVPPRAMDAVPGLEFTSNPAPPMVTMPDPALVIGPSGYSDFFVKVAEPNLVSGEPSKTAEDDFEARVAAAMAGYDDGGDAGANSLTAAKATEASASTPPAQPGQERQSVMADPILEKIYAEAEAAVTRLEDTQPMEAVVEMQPTESPLSSPEIEVADPYADVPESKRPPLGMQDASLVEQMLDNAGTPAATPEPSMPEVPTSVIPPASAAQDALAAAAGVDVTRVAPPAAGDSPQSIDAYSAAKAINRVLERMLPEIMTEVTKELKKQ